MSNIIYGINSVNEAIKSKNTVIAEIIVELSKKNKRIDKILNEADKRSIPVKRLALDEISLICQKNHQGVLARISDFTFKELPELLSELKDKGKAKLLFLDCINDTGNLGALIRSACAFSFDGVVIQEKRSASVTPSVVKASSGAVFHIPICLVNNLNNALKSAKEAGFWAAALLADASKSIYELDMDMKTALVIGNEESGIRELVLKNCDFAVSIPISERIDSLNASAAGACAMYEILRQQRKD